MLRAAGIFFLALRSPGETRQSLTVTEDATGKQFRFMLPGPDWREEDQEQVFTLLGATARDGGIGVISGSQPPGVPPDFPARLAAAMQGMQVVLDTSGTALTRSVTAPIPGLAVLRMDSHEAEGLAGHPLPRAKDTAEFAQSLRQRGVAERVIVARGAEGNVLAEAGRSIMASPPQVSLVSSVGAGDSFVAGLVLAMARGQAWDQAMALATASAAAAVMTEATELCHPEDVLRLLPQVRVTAV
jgi:6-phosphofructokinase 2